VQTIWLLRLSLAQHTYTTYSLYPTLSSELSLDVAWHPKMNIPVPITSIETLPAELLEWLGERKIKPGDGDLWVLSVLQTISVLNDVVNV
jgi:hypothetical protein